MNEQAQYELLYSQDPDKIAAVATIMLMDDHISTYKMIEDLASQYYHQDDESYKKGMNYISSTVFGFDIPDLIQYINQKLEEKNINLL